VGTYRRLSDPEAVALNRKQLQDRIREENVYWERRSRRRMSAADRAAMMQFGTLLHRYVDLDMMLAHTIALAQGEQPPDYLASRVDGSAPRSPRRMQLSRQRGYRLPYGVRVVSRAGAYGNPFTGRLAVEEFARFLGERHTGSGKAVYAGIRYPSDEEIAQLAGWDLACWCALTTEPGLHCHADVLLYRANRNTAFRRHE